MTVRGESTAVRQALRAAIRAAYVYAADDETPEQVAKRIAPSGYARAAEVRRWAADDDWVQLRADFKRRQRAAAPATVAEVADERQRAHIEALEQLGKRAWSMMQGMRPRSWEAAASIYVRCIELLNQFELARADTGPAKLTPDANAMLADANLPPLTEGQLDMMADIMLRSASQNPPDTGDPKA